MRNATAIPVALNQLACEGAAFARNLILARLLGPQEMGAAVALALCLRLLEMLGDFGWDRLLVQVHRDDLPTLRPTVHGLQVLKGAGQTLLAAALGIPALVWLFPNLSLPAWLLISLALLVRGAVHWDYRERQRQNRFGPALLVEGGSNLIALALTLPIAWMIPDHTALAWSMLIQACVFTLLSHWVAQQPYRVRLDRQSIDRCLRYGLPLAANALLMFVALQGDRVVVSVFFTPAQLAAFALAAQLTLLPALLGARVILTLKLPEYARLLPHRELLTARFDRDTRIVAVLAIGLAVFFGTAGGFIIEALYGAAYASSALSIWLLAIAAALRLMRALPTTLIMSTENTTVLLWLNAPRLLALPLALGLAAWGAALPTILSLAVASEVISLAMSATLAHRERQGPRPLGHQPPYQEAT